MTAHLRGVKDDESPPWRKRCAVVAVWNTESLSQVLPVDAEAVVAYGVVHRYILQSRQS